MTVAGGELGSLRVEGGQVGLEDRVEQGCVLHARNDDGLAEFQSAQAGGDHVLAANELAAAVSPRLVPGGNRLRDVFLDPAERTLYPDWEGSARQLVAGFRKSVGTDVDDPHVMELVGRLSLASPRFRELWARHDVHRHEGATVALADPQVGPLTLNREKLAIPGTAGQLLTIYHPEPGTDDADRFALLASSAFPVHERSGQDDAPHR